MRDATLDITRRVFGGLAAAWRPVLLIHIAFSLLGLTVLAPLTALLVRALVALSGDPVVADQQIIDFLLSPLGFAALVIVAAVLIAIIAVEQGAMMAIGFAELQGWHLTGWQAIAFAARRPLEILQLAARIVVNALAIAVPFLIVGAAIYLLLLTDYDINYYLAERPSDFWLAALMIGVVLLAMGVLLLRRLAGWSLALPFLLFHPTGPREALNLSVQHTQGRRATVVRWWLAWMVTVIVVNAVGVAVLDILGEMIVPSVATSLPQVLGIVSVLGVVAVAIGIVLGAFATAGFAFVNLALFDRWLPRVRDTSPQIGTVAKEDALPPGWRRIAGWSLAGAVALALLTAFLLLRSVRPEDHVEIIAHRGAAGRAPENTLASIRAAIEDSTDWVEIDVQESADGEVVVVHDSDFMKLAGVDLKVWNGSFDDIRAIDAGAWFAEQFTGEHVPTLAEVLCEARGRARVVIELKYYGHDQDLERRVAAIVEAAGMQDDVAIMSLDYRGVQKFRELRPEWPIGVLMARGAGRLTDLDVDFLAVNAGMAKRRLIRTAHAAGKQIYVWTINDPVQMSGMISLGVDALITDEPALARRVLAYRAELNVAERILIQGADRFDWLPAPRDYRDESP